jgi:hypothetical protein
MAKMPKKYPYIFSIGMDIETFNRLEELALKRMISKAELIRELIRREASLPADEPWEREISTEVCIKLLHELDIRDKPKSLVQDLLKRGYIKVEYHENGYVFRIEPVLFPFLKNFNMLHETDYTFEDIYNILVKLIRKVNPSVRAKIEIPSSY